MTHHPLTNPPTVISRFPGGKFKVGLVIVAVVSVVYAGAYVVLRATHRIRCSSNAWHWHPEKWDLAHHFDIDAPVRPWSPVFKPLMLAEEMMRVAAAWLAHELPHGTVICAGLIIAIFSGWIGVGWLCVSRWISLRRGMRQ